VPRRSGAICSLPGDDHPIELQNLLPDTEQLSTERGKARTGNLWHPLVVGVGNNMQQFRDTFAPDRRDKAELGEMRSDRIDYRGLLADEQGGSGEASGSSAARVSLLARTAYWLWRRLHKLPLRQPCRSSAV
jgi:hypothetical protein